MGAVYVAEQVSLSRQVAVKVFSPALTPEPESRAQFLREIKMTAALDHPNIATAYGAGEANDLVYLAMKYVDGRDLGELLLEYPRIDERDALDVVEGISKALAYAWERQRLIHRDIKPSNIKLDQSAVPHLLDLGISVSAEHRCELDEAGIVLGTPHYMSPEQARGNGEMDFRTDVYSLGATLYHMITGRTTQADAAPAEVLLAVLNNEIVPASEVNPKISAGVNDLVMRMLASDPNERQGSWETVLEEIELARATRADARTTRRIRRPTGGLKLSINSDPVAGESQARPPAGKKRQLPTTLIGCLVAGLLMGGFFWVTRPGTTGTKAEAVTEVPKEPASDVVTSENARLESEVATNRVPTLMAMSRETPAALDALQDRIQKYHDEPASDEEKMTAKAALRALRDEVNSGDQLIQSLRKEWVEMARAGNGESALAALRAYNGTRSGWVQAHRGMLQAAISGAIDAFEARQRQAGIEIAKQRKRAAKAMASMDFATARSCLGKMRELGVPTSTIDSLMPLTNVDLDLANTFVADVGKSLVLKMSNDAEMELKVLGVDGAKIRLGRQDPALGIVERVVTYQDLAYGTCEQRLLALSNGKTRALVLGLGFKQQRINSLRMLRTIEDSFIQEIIASCEADR